MKQNEIVGELLNTGIWRWISLFPEYQAGKFIEELNKMGYKIVPITVKECTCDGHCGCKNE